MAAPQTLQTRNRTPDISGVGGRGWGCPLGGYSRHFPGGPGLQRKSAPPKHYFAAPLRASSSAPRTGSITLGLRVALGCSEQRQL
jgi:hypothetical protein